MAPIQPGIGQMAQPRMQQGMAQMQAGFQPGPWPAPTNWVFCPSVLYPCPTQPGAVCPVYREFPGPSIGVNCLSVLYPCPTQAGTCPVYREFPGPSIGVNCPSVITFCHSVPMLTCEV
jgi:hypothetical protein